MLMFVGLWMTTTYFMMLVQLVKDETPKRSTPGLPDFEFEVKRPERSKSGEKCQEVGKAMSGYQAWGDTHKHTGKSREIPKVPRQKREFLQEGVEIWSCEYPICIFPNCRC